MRVWNLPGKAGMFSSGWLENMMFRARLLGAFSLDCDSSPIGLPRGESSRRILIHLLLCHGQELKRSSIAGRVWPDSTEAQARTNLRREIHQLRLSHSLFTNCIHSGRTHLQWVMPDEFRIDVDSFCMGYDAFFANTVDESQLGTGLNVLSIYSGDLLEGYTDDWIVERRLQLTQQWIHLAETILRLQNDVGEFEPAVSLAKRIIAIEPLRESIYLELMRAHEGSGNSALALHTFHECAAILQAELGVRPNTELEQQYRVLTQLQTESAMLPETGCAVLPHADVSLVGRDHESNQLRRELLAPAANSRLILISGEAGIGKTRLANDTLRWAENSRFSIARARCHAAAGDLALSVFHGWLESPLLQSLLAAVDPWWRDVIEDLFTHSRSLEDHSENTSDVGSRNATRLTQFEALAQLLTVELPAESPAELKSNALSRIFFVDDIQWADSDFIAFLSYLFNQKHRLPIVLVATQRIEDSTFNTPFNELLCRLSLEDKLIELTLDALTLLESESLAHQIVSNKQQLIPAGLNLQGIYNWTRGNPFYLTETMLHIATSDVEMQTYVKTGHTLAPKITSIVQERLLSLQPGARELIQCASVVGRSFSVPLLSDLLAADELVLVGLLDELWHRKFIREVANGEYDFNHDCIRETSYELLSVPQRRSLHSRVAKALERLHAHNLKPVAGQIAANWSRAGDYDEAYPWYFMALMRAHSKFHYHEALDYVESCLEILDRSDAERDDVSQRAILLQIKSTVLSLIDCFGGDRERSVCDQLERLNAVLKDQKMVFNSLSRIRIFASFSGQLHKATLCVQQQMDIALSLDDSLMIMESYRSKVFLQYQLGDYSTMLHAASEGVRVIERVEQENLSKPENPLWSVTMLRQMHVFALQLSGKHKEARQALDTCANYADSLGDDHVLGLLHFWMCHILRLCDKPAEADAVGQQLQHIGERSALLKLRGMGLSACAWAAARCGDLESASEQLQVCLSEIESTKEYHLLIDLSVALAAIAIQQGHSTEANDWLYKAEQWMLDSKIATNQAQVLRLRAELKALNGADSTDVLRSYQKACLLAKQQGATLYHIAALNSELQYRQAGGFPVKRVQQELKRLNSDCETLRSHHQDQPSENVAEKAAESLNSVPAY